MNLAEVLQDTELDWEYEISRWLGPVGAQLLGSSLRNPLDWLRDSAARCAGIWPTISAKSRARWSARPKPGALRRTG